MYIIYSLFFFLLGEDISPLLVEAGRVLMLRISLLDDRAFAQYPSSHHSLNKQSTGLFVFIARA